MSPLNLSRSADVSQTLIQPFVNYNLPDAWYLTSAPIITANWKAADGDKWTVPIGLGVGKIEKFGKLPVNLQLAAYLPGREALGGSNPSPSATSQALA